MRDGRYAPLNARAAGFVVKTGAAARVRSRRLRHDPMIQRQWALGLAALRVNAGRQLKRMQELLGVLPDLRRMRAKREPEADEVGLRELRR
jgi:hypothetical protein